MTPDYEDTILFRIFDRCFVHYTITLFRLTARVAVAKRMKLEQEITELRAF